MIVGLKDGLKLVGISIVCCCAVFVCTLFLNYNTDLVTIKDEVTSEAGLALYNAQISMGKVTCGVTGGCLIITSAVMLIFFIKSYIDSHGKELGILKALGYSALRVAVHFWVFGLSILVGCVIGFLAAFFYMPHFYEVQNAEGLYPEVSVHFHPLLSFLLTGAPTLLFIMIAVLYAFIKLKMPVLDLLRERRECKFKVSKKEKDLPFLKDLKRNTVKSRKTLVFFIGFSAFCFSAMTQMSMSMNKLASQTFAFMIITIGLILAFVTLFMSLATVVKANGKTIAMMKAFGYQQKECGKAILGGYRPVSYIGFAVGTVYQYALLKAVMTFVFNDIDNMPEYHFDAAALVVSLISFVTVYELITYAYIRQLGRISVRKIMLDTD